VPGLRPECSMVLEFDLFRVHEQLKAACSRASGDSPLHVFVAGLYADSAVALKILTVSGTKLPLPLLLSTIGLHGRRRGDAGRGGGVGSTSLADSLGGDKLTMELTSCPLLTELLQSAG